MDELQLLGLMFIIQLSNFVNFLLDNITFITSVFLAIYFVIFLRYVRMYVRGGYETAEELVLRKNHDKIQIDVDAEEEVKRIELTTEEYESLKRVLEKLEEAEESEGSDSSNNSFDDE